MNRISSFLALSAIVIAGAFAGTAAQASANPSVNFNVHNADASASMIRIGTLPSDITGLINPAAAVLAGNYDPASGSALYTAPALSVGRSASESVTYANASDGVSNQCTFTMKITRPALASYTLQFSIAPGATGVCTVPAGAANSTGVFAGPYTVGWSV